VGYNFVADIMGLFSFI